MKTGFDSEKYLSEQSQAILERAGKFDDKLYLEFGGKLLATSMPRASCRGSIRIPRSNSCSA